MKFNPQWWDRPLVKFIIRRKTNKWGFLIIINFQFLIYGRVNLRYEWAAWLYGPSAYLLVYTIKKKNIVYVNQLIYTMHLFFSLTKVWTIWKLRILRIMAVITECLITSWFYVKQERNITMVSCPIGYLIGACQSERQMLKHCDLVTTTTSTNALFSLH